MASLSLTERRNKILEIIGEKGRVTVGELSALFGVSNVVIRTDLAELEKQDLLSRIHGGAITSYKSYFDMSLVQRSNINSSEKAAIARRIAGEIQENSTVILNAGTTPLFVMRALSAKKLTILTNSIALALEGAANPNFNIILLGGDVDSHYQFTYGVNALAELERYNADTLVLSVDGVDGQMGISTFYHQEAEICRSMIRHAKRTVIAADYSKIGRLAFTLVGSLDSVDTIVTNDRVPPSYIRKLKSRGLQIITV